MPKIESRAFTLIEMILVVSMIVILAAIATSSYSKSKNKAISREAIANLKLIAAAERIYKMEGKFNIYAFCDKTEDCSAALNLNLNSTNWGYDVKVNNSTGVATITATGVAISGCNYTLGSGTDGTGFDLEPTGSGC